MMCSTWKISVFGILALILAFGLVTTNALAQPAPYVTVSATSADPAIDALRAADKATITFSVEVAPHTTEGDQKAGEIRIKIPSDWSSPIYADNATGDLGAREVRVGATTGSGDGEIRGSISGRDLVVNVGKAATGTITFVFQTVTPPTMRRHGFQITSTNHAIRDDAIDNTTGDPVSPDPDADQIRKRGGRYFLDVEVGAIRSGTDHFTLTGGNNLHQQPSNDDDPPHEGKFLVFSEATLGNVAISYNVPGTMPKGSQFIVTIASVGNAWDITRDDDTQASASTNMAIERTGTTVTGTLKSTLQKGARLTINLKHLKAPKVGDQPATAINTGYSIQAQTAVEASLSPADPTTTRESAAPTGDGVPQFDFVTTRADGTGRLRVHSASPAADDNVLTYHAAGADLGTLTIVLDTLTGNAAGSKYEITLPPPTADGWPTPFKPIAATSTDDGALSGGDLAGDIPRQAGAANNDPISADDSVTLTYHVAKAPTREGPYVFNAKTSAGPHGSLAALGGHTVHITAPHGSGMLELVDSSGNPLVRATDAAEVDNLRFRYKPAGYMPKDAELEITLPDGWTDARADNPGDGSDDPGEITVSAKARVEVTDATTGNSGILTVVATEAWGSGDTIVVTYKKVKVADIADGTTRSDVFSARSKSFGADTNFAGLAASPIVGIGRDPDGTGSISLSVTETDTATAIGTLMITYAAAGKMEIGSVVEITIPDTGDWPDPTVAGNFSLSDETRASPSSTATTMSATTTTEFASGDRITFVYNNIGAQSIGIYTFSATSTVTYDGTPTPLGTGPAEIEVKTVVPGRLELTYMKDEMTHTLTSATPDQELGQLTFTFTTQAPMGSGSKIQITIEDGWDEPFQGNNASDDRRGAIWTDDGTVAIAAVPDTGWTVTITTGAALGTGDDVTVTYSGVMAPSEEKTYNFDTMASVDSEGDLVSITVVPRVTVREAITELAIAVDKASVFIGEPIEVTVSLMDADGEGSAPLAGLVIELSDTDASDMDADGTFDPVSIMIGDGGSSGMATYTNNMMGTVTLTATAVGLDDVEPVDAVVTIKSTVSDLQVNGMSKGPVEVDSGGALTVMVIGQPGGGSVKVTQTETDADGEEIVKAVVQTLSLDINHDAEDVPEGSVAYIRRDIPLGELPDGDYMIELVVGGEDAEIALQVVTPRDPVTAITITAAESFFAGDSIQVTVASDVRAPEGGLEVMLSTDPADSGMFMMDGEAVTSVTIEDAEDMMSAMVYYTNSDAGDVTLTATAGELSADAEVSVMAVISSLQVNGMDEPEAVAGDATITVSAVGKDGTGTVQITDAEGEVVVSEKGLDKDADAADVPEGSAAYSRDIALPDLEDGDYMVTVSIAGASMSVALEVMAPRDPVTAITLTASAGSFFAGDSIQLTVASDVRTPVGGLEVMLSTDPADSGMFSMTEGGEAVSSVMIPDAEDMMSAMVYYTNSDAGDVTLTATAGDLTDSADVTVKATISNLQVNGMDEPHPVRKDATISVTASGKDGRASAAITDSDGESVVSGLGLDGEADDEGNVAYSRDIALPSLDDGKYTVTVTIAGESASIGFEVLDDQTAPTLAEASARPVQSDYAVNGKEVVFSVNVALNTSGIGIASVTADVSELDSTLTGEDAKIELQEWPTGSGAYNRILTVSADNKQADGSKTITFMATDRVGNESEPLTATVTLKNDQIAPVLTMASASPSPAADGTVITISVMSESGLTVMADASAIGGGDMVALTEPMAAPAVEAANGNGANGNGANGNGANGNGANGDVMYSGTATVTDAADGEQTITITGTDASDNVSMPAMASVTIDNTGPMLSDAGADPAMATNGTDVTISVSTESGATVMADASAIGGGDMVALMESADTAGMYSAMVTVTDAMDGDQMISISGTDALGNAGDAVSVSVSVDNTAPMLSDAAVTPDWALNGDTVTISVNGGESGLTVTADASAIGGAADEALAESADTAGMYSAEVEVTGAAGGDQMVSISASDALGNMSDAVSASVSIHAVTMASFSPADVSTGDTVMVSAMGTAGLTATYSVFDAEGMKIVTDGALTEDAANPGSYSGMFEVVVDAHPTGTYWVSVDIGQASKTAEGALTIDHVAQFDLMIGTGTHLIHVPLDVTHIDGMAATINTVRDLYNALGDAVNIIITLGADGSWNSYLGDDAPGAAFGDMMLGDSTGLVAVMNSAATLKLAGNPLGTGGVSTITLKAGNNLVGVPLAGDPKLPMISSALAVPGISAVVVSRAGGDGFDTITQAGDPGDGPLMGGRGYIVVAAAGGDVPIIGNAWENMADDSAPMAAPPAAFGVKTPVLHVRGKLIDEAGMMSLDGLNVSINNLTSGVALGNTLATDEYSMTFVKLDDTAAKVGDVLEIKADSGNPLLGIRPVQHVVTAEDVLNNSISLPDLVTYEIPAQTELLANYPNPFNPETWIPFRLAEDASVSLSIYGASGSLVRTIDVGFTPAAVYEGRSDAIYWDGRNNFGEQVSSGIYFYHLQAGEFSATRKMVVVK